VNIGAGAKIIGGVTVGNNAVIGANAVVIADIPPFTLAVEIPEKNYKKMDINMNKYNFIGVDIEALTYQQMFKIVDSWFQKPIAKSRHIAVINAYCATMALDNPRLKKIYNKADITGPDGKPFVYWLQRYFRSECDQFDASSLLIEFCKRAKIKNYSFYLYGGHLDVVEQMKKNLELMFPYLDIVGYYSPPFRKLTTEEDKKIVHEINRLNPDVICVGLGTPKQDYWIEEHKEIINSAVFLPCGAIFDFFGGRVPRAPKWVSKFCLEWFYRLLGKDFKRLWYRYTVMNVIFLWNFFLQLTGKEYGSSQPSE